jgi:hypothetical protein
MPSASLHVFATRLRWTINKHVQITLAGRENLRFKLSRLDRELYAISSSSLGLRLTVGSRSHRCECCAAADRIFVAKSTAVERELLRFQGVRGLVALQSADAEPFQSAHAVADRTKGPVSNLEAERSSIDEIIVAMGYFRFNRIGPWSASDEKIGP